MKKNVLPQTNFSNSTQKSRFTTHAKFKQRSIKKKNLFKKLDKKCGFTTQIFFITTQLLKSDLIARYYDSKQLLYGDGKL